MSQCCETNSPKDKTSCGKTECCDIQTKCPSQSDSPVDCAADMWRHAFGEAMKQVQVDLLKARITKAWGPMMDASADALIASMGARWESMIADVKAQEACGEFNHKLHDLWLSAKK